MQKNRFLLNTLTQPEQSTELYDVRRLADLLNVKPATIRTLRHRNQLPEPTATDINGGAVWSKSLINDFFDIKDDDKTISKEINFEANLPKVIDLFCGCGGMSLGFQQSGFEVLEGFDNWDCAVATYSANLNHKATLLDLGNIDATINELNKFKNGDSFPAIVGGPPCQDFSSAGTRIEGSRADLTEKFALIIKTFLPPFFLMENVARAENAAAFKRALEIMSDSGYIIKKTIIDSSFCNVPQKRKRLITIGTKSEDLTNKIFTWIENNQSQNPMTVREWFSDRLDTKTYYRHPRSYARRGVFSIDEPSPTIRGVNRPIPNGYKMHPGDAGPISQTRPLTTSERAQIQTFPEDFKFLSSRTDAEQMIGNAVPVNLAKFIATAISKSLKS